MRSDYPLKGRLIKINNEVVFLCMDGTVAEVNNMLLTKIFTNFRQPELLTGLYGRWDIGEPDICMWKVPGEPLADITPNSLIIYQPSAFNSILSGNNPNEYITVLEYAKKNNRSVSRIKQLCSEGRIAGAVRKNGSWLIPITAEYPADRRHWNKQK